MEEYILQELEMSLYRLADAQNSALRSSSFEELIIAYKYKVGTYIDLCIVLGFNYSHIVVTSGSITLRADEAHSFDYLV